MRRHEHLAAVREVLAALNDRTHVAPLSREELAARDKRANEEKARGIRRAVVDLIPLPDEDRRAIVANALEDTFALRVVRKWMSAKPTPALVLLGGVGTGKTVAGAYAAASFGGMYIAANELRTRLTRAAWDGDPTPAFLRARFLLVDDLGVEKDKPEDFGPELYKLVSARQRDTTRTIFTSNLTREQLAARYDARIVDRLSAMAHVIEVPGASLRRKTAALL